MSVNLGDHHLPDNVNMHQRQHSHRLQPLIILPDNVLDLLGELPSDLVLHLVHLPNHNLATLVDQQRQTELESESVTNGPINLSNQDRC